jgi:RHS repeat-associated protein
MTEVIPVGNSHYAFLTAKERDPESNLDYFGARYFSGAQGRFTSPDPVIVTPARMLDPQRFNLYAYARNHPFKFIDPNGEDIEFVNDTEEGRKKALALITRNLSAKEAANIGIRQTPIGPPDPPTIYALHTMSIGGEQVLEAADAELWCWLSHGRLDLLL